MLLVFIVSLCSACGCICIMWLYNICNSRFCNSYVTVSGKVSFWLFRTHLTTPTYEAIKIKIKNHYNLPRYPVYSNSIWFLKVSNRKFNNWCRILGYINPINWFQNWICPVKCKVSRVVSQCLGTMTTEEIDVLHTIDKLSNFTSHGEKYWW